MKFIPGEHDIVFLEEAESGGAGDERMRWGEVQPFLIKTDLEEKIRLCCL